MSNVSSLSAATNVEGAACSSPMKRNRSDLEDGADKKSGASSVFLDLPTPQVVALKCDREVTLPLLDASVPIPEMSMQELFGADAAAKSQPDTHNKSFPDLPSPSEPEPKKKHKKIDDPVQKMTPGQISEFFKQPVMSPGLETPEKASYPWDMAPPPSTTASRTSISKPDTDTGEDVGEEPIVQSVFLDMPTPKNDPPTPDPKACLPMPNAELTTPLALRDLFGDDTVSSPSVSKRRRGLEFSGREGAENGFDREFNTEVGENTTSGKTKRKKDSLIGKSTDEQDFKKSKPQTDAAADEVEAAPTLPLVEGKSTTIDDQRTTDSGANKNPTKEGVELLATDPQEESKPTPEANAKPYNPSAPVHPQPTPEDLDEAPSEEGSGAPVAVPITTTEPIAACAPQPEEPMPADTKTTPVQEPDA